MKFAVVTFGCRVNQADSFQIEDTLRRRGAEGVAPAEADVVIVNSCSVTASADQGTRQTIRRIVRQNPAVKVVVTGCYATRRPAEVGALPNVVRVVGNRSKDTLAEGLEEAFGLAAPTPGGDGDGPCGAALHPGVAGRTALTLRVQTGCDEVCSYCIIPRTRGQGRSLGLPHVLDRVRTAVDAGYKEIVITGVHLGSYGRDLDEKTTLTALVRALADWPADVLFRISSLEPMDCAPEIVRLVAQSPRLAPHFHLPLQHGCDLMLRAMRRPYSASFYRDLVGMIHASVPHASIGTDIIVGFPGEQDEHFSRTIALLEGLPLSHVHVFPYSDRPGTDAAGRTAKVGGADIRARGQATRTVAERLRRAFQTRQIGTTRRALTVDDGSQAVTDNYLKIRLQRQRPRNEWVDVIVAGAPGALTEDAGARS